MNHLKNGHFPAVPLSKNNCLSFRPEQVLMLIECVQDHNWVKALQEAGTVRPCKLLVTSHVTA